MSLFSLKPEPGVGEFCLGIKEQTTRKSLTLLLGTDNSGTPLELSQIGGYISPSVCLFWVQCLQGHP